MAQLFEHKFLKVWFAINSIVQICSNMVRNTDLSTQIILFFRNCGLPIANVNDVTTPAEESVKQMVLVAIAYLTKMIPHALVSKDSSPF